MVDRKTRFPQVKSIKRRAIDATGFRIADAEDFLDLSEKERQLVELRLSVSRTVRRLREAQKLTQKELASRLKSSQSRVAKLEVGSGDVSLDLLFRGLFALGGNVSDVTAVPGKRKRAAATPRTG